MQQPGAPSSWIAPDVGTEGRPSFSSSRSQPPQYLEVPPPPQRNTPEPQRVSAEPGKTSTWKQSMTMRAKALGEKAMAKGEIWNDKIGHKVNGWAESSGSERFWPTSGDFAQEVEKATRILKAFTVNGVEIKDKNAKGKNQRRVLKKIPAKAFADAKGVCIFTSMRTGSAPLAGAGGAGLVLAKLPDGTWSAPASISPNNISAGFMFGLDVYDAVLIIRTQKALDSFMSHKVTLGGELGLTVGPWGSGVAVEMGKDTSPIWSYVRSRGFYYGIEGVAQVFVARNDANASQYGMGIKPIDILSGKVAVPFEVVPLLQALYDAETGLGQRLHGAEQEYETTIPYEGFGEEKKLSA